MLEWNWLLSGHPFVVMVIANLFACVVLAFMAMGTLAAILEQMKLGPLSKTWVWTTFGLCFATLAPLYVWAFFIAPGRDFLILHEKGFRYRLNGRYPSKEFLFSQIRLLQIGDKIEGSWIEATMKVLRPGIGKDLSFRRQTAVEVRMKSGGAKRIEYLLVRFDPEDIAKFVTALTARFEQVKAAEIADFSM